MFQKNNKVQDPEAINIQEIISAWNHPKITALVHKFKMGTVTPEEIQQMFQLGLLAQVEKQWLLAIGFFSLAKQFHHPEASLYLTQSVKGFMQDVPLKKELKI